VWNSRRGDLAAALFVIGGVISFVAALLTLPITSIYPFDLPQTFSFVFAVVLTVAVICSLGAIHCYSLAISRRLSRAGLRGIIFGAILLALSLGLVRAIPELNTQLITGSAILILVAGAICFILREPSMIQATASQIPVQQRQ